jgi:hypothetical protein
MTPHVFELQKDTGVKMGMQAWLPRKCSRSGCLQPRNSFGLPCEFDADCDVEIVRRIQES